MVSPVQFRHKEVQQSGHDPQSLMWLQLHQVRFHLLDAVMFHQLLITKPDQTRILIPLPLLPPTSQT
jgi:hypothetical protein